MAHLLYIRIEAEQRTAQYKRFFRYYVGIRAIFVHMGKVRKECMPKGFRERMDCLFSVNYGTIKKKEHPLFEMAQPFEEEK